NLNPICSEYIYEVNSPFNGSAKDKGKAFMNLYKNDEVKAIFDISGGDLANEVLDYLDYDYIFKNPKPFFGYSDLTTVLNAIYSQTNNSVYLYQVRNLIYSDSENQKSNFINSLFNDKDDLFNFSYKFIQGTKIEGIVVGGNIRCFLKLAGTKYMPDFTDKVLFLESMGGEAGLMSAFLNQLKQMGAFDKIQGLILGTFSKMQENNISPTIEELVVKIINNPDLPIAKTEEIGHRANSKCIVIGKNIILK
ncbi:S66 peptidase family protein, partial [Clostridium sp.]|uniref:S66 family peptidase n=1 Tax=Clostridium sp. TaxID=1506 RepID=UPI001B507C23